MIKHSFFVLLSIGARRRFRAHFELYSINGSGLRPAQFAGVIAAAMMAFIAPAQAGGDHELPEPFFTEQAATSTEVELEFGFDHKKAEDEYEIGIGGSWEAVHGLEFGVEIPYEIRNPDEDPNERAFGDIEFSAKYQFSELSESGFDLAVAASVAAPTGDRDKEIGGTGEWGVSALAGTPIKLGNGLPELGAHFQLSYQQQIKLSNEQKEEAEELGVGQIREKELIWRLALGAPILKNRFVPTVEFLGRTILDAVDQNEEGTIIEIGGGFWWNPLADTEEPGPLSLGVAAKAPVTNRRDAEFSALFVVKYEFD